MKKPNGYWNEERCRIESMKYTTLKEFREKSGTAYSVARKNGWLKNYDWLVRVKSPDWTEDTCRKEAKKYDSKKDFVKYSSGAYTAARKNGWLKDYDWLSELHKYNYWTKEACREEAMKYKTKSEFETKSGSAYVKARKNGWLKDYDWFEEICKPRGYWNEETCREEAKKFKTKKEFKRVSSGAYNKAQKNGWLKDYDWFEEICKPRGYWNEETCREEAMKCKTIKEFKKCSYSAYTNAWKNGWLNDYDWFFRVQKPHGYWNEETCREESKKYKTRTEFEKSASSAYKKALKNGWLNDYDWFDEIYKPNGYWNEETCREESKKFKTKNEFERGASGAYAVANKNGWIDSYVWLRDTRLKDIKGKIDLVYAYEFIEHNTVYVGRTVDVKSRDWDHIFDKQESTYIFAKSHNVPVPEVKIIENNLTLDESSNHREGYWIQWYKEHGWNVLNKAKAGSLGGLAKGKWTKKTCREEAKKYKTKSEFKAKSGGAYGRARKNGWLKDYDWFDEVRKPNGYWNEKTCREEALKYNTKVSFSENAKSAYHYAINNGWIDSYYWFVNGRVKWTEEACREEAKKYKTRAQFHRKSNRAYDIARKNGWLDSYTWLPKLRA